MNTKLVRKLCWLVVGVGLFAGVSAAQDDASIPATAYQTVNVRSGPGTYYEIVGRLTAGDDVLVDGRAESDAMWLHIVMSDGHLGWVSAFVLLLEGDVMTLPVFTDGTSIEAAPDDPVLVIAIGRVNVRTEPTLMADVVGQMEVESSAVAIARSNAENDWLYVQHTNDDETFEGWVAYFTVRVEGDTENLPVRQPADTGELVAPSQLIDTLYNVRLRAEASLDSDVVTIIPFATTVTPIGRTGDAEWLYVVYENVEGWASSDLFDIDADYLNVLPVQEARALQISATPVPNSIIIPPNVTPVG